VTCASVAEMLLTTVLAPQWNVNTPGNRADRIILLATSGVTCNSTCQNKFIMWRMMKTWRERHASALAGPRDRERRFRVYK